MASTSQWGPRQGQTWPYRITRRSRLVQWATAPWSDGTYQIELSPLELIEKLAALVPPPRLNLVRYHGVLAPHAADRAQMVPGPQEENAAEVAADGMAPLPPSRARRSWAQLLRRVFEHATDCTSRNRGDR